MVYSGVYCTPLMHSRPSIYRLSLRISLKQAEIICMQFGCSSLATLAELEHVALKNLLVCWLVSRIVD